MDQRDKQKWVVPDEVFWAEIEEIDRLRSARTAGASRVDGGEPPGFAKAVAAVEVVRKAEQTLADAEKQAPRLDRLRHELADSVSRVLPGERLAKLLGTTATPGVEKARAALDLARERAREEAQPACGLGLVGLALSGGGIRSATFNLGVLQVFAKRGLLSNADYLSSVSGGGYIGGTLSTLVSSPGAEPGARAFPLRHERGVLESAALKHLRQGASYLAPDGVLDRIRIPALALRGLIVNLLLLMPYLLWLTVATYLLWGPDLERASRFATLDLSQSGRITLGYEVTLIVAALLVAWSVAFPLVRRLVPLSWSARNNTERAFALAFAAAVAVALASTLPVAVWYYERKDVIRTVVASGWLGTFATIVVPMLPLLLASGSTRVLETWRGRVMIYALGLLGPVVLLVLYLEITTWRIFRPSSKLTNFFCLDPGWREACPGWWSAIVGGVEDVLRVTNPGLAPLDWTLVVLGALLFVYSWRAVDVNITALHGFYRDRISRAYLFREPKEDGSEGEDVVPVDDLRMSDMGSPQPRGPYHLVNATLNLQASREASGRRADFFLFSKRFVGSRSTSYCQTRRMEDKDPALNLGTAVAVSGAALAPNMGSSTNRALVFVMTLLNVRTGYWLPNPAKVMAGGGPFGGVGPWFLLLELFGLLNERSRYVNVSDGGHIENLGLYELLRRRCKYIVVCDAEHDPQLAFSSLAKVKQYVRIDGSAEIDLDMTKIAGDRDQDRRDDAAPKDASRRSERYWTMGRIRYDSGEDGYILYLKASVTGREAVDLRSYRAENPAFPHEATSQQFFKEGQVEAYRALGYHIADEVFNVAPLRGVAPNDVRAWFEALDPPPPAPAGAPAKPPAAGRSVPAGHGAGGRRARRRRGARRPAPSPPGDNARPSPPEGERVG